jgi:hypothetical protein
MGLEFVCWSVERKKWMDPQSMLETELFWLWGEKIRMVSRSPPVFWLEQQGGGQMPLAEMEDRSETRVLDPGPKLLRFHMPGLATCP